LIGCSSQLDLLSSYDLRNPDLGAAEKYFIAIRDVPRLARRIKAMIFKRRFEIEYSDVKNDVTVIKTTIKEVRGSGRFRKLLEVNEIMCLYKSLTQTYNQLVLQLGNYLNGGTFRGQAYGFTLETLNKLRDTKANEQSEAAKKGAISLLHYLVMVSDNEKIGVVDYSEEISHLESAGRICFSSVASLTRKFREDAQSMSLEIDALSSAEEKVAEDRFLTLMKPFFKEMDDLVKTLENQVTTTESQFKELAEWLGEDTTATIKTPDDLWAVLGDFSAAVKVSPLSSLFLEYLANRL